MQRDKAAIVIKASKGIVTKSRRAQFESNVLHLAVHLMVGISRHIEVPENQSHCHNSKNRLRVSES